MNGILIGLNNIAAILGYNLSPRRLNAFAPAFCRLLRCSLEDLYAEGIIHAIGVSNFYPDRLIDLCSFARIKPMVN